MNDWREQHWHDTDGPGPDLVDDFFAAHRARIQEPLADDATWEVIRERADRGGSRGAGVWFLGGAVAASALVAAVLTSGVLDEGGPEVTPAGDGGSSTASVVTATDEPGEAGEAERTGGAIEDATPAPDAATQDVAAPTTPGKTGGIVGDGSSPAQVETEEASAPRALPGAPGGAVISADEPSGDADLRVATFDTGAGRGLAVSHDGGASFSRAVGLGEAGYEDAMASRERMWAWGDGSDGGTAGLVRSDDGGGTWIDIATRGEGVLAAEAFRSTLVVVTEGCEGGSASDCAEIVVTDVAAADVRDGRRVVTLTDLPADHGGELAGRSVTVQATYDAIYVRFHGRDQVYRVADGEASALLIPTDGCTLSTAPESADTLLAACPGQDPAIARSTDGGQSWSAVPAPEGKVMAVGSNDGSTLVAVTESGLQRSTDDGATWEQTLERSAMSGTVLPLGGSTLRAGGGYASLPGEEPTLADRWLSEDGGSSWSQLPSLDF